MCNGLGLDLSHDLSQSRSVEKIAGVDRSHTAWKRCIGRSSAVDKAMDLMTLCSQQRSKVSPSESICTSNENASHGLD